MEEHLYESMYVRTYNQVKRAGTIKHKHKQANQCAAYAFAASRKKRRKLHVTKRKKTHKQYKTKHNTTEKHAHRLSTVP